MVGLKAGVGKLRYWTKKLKLNNTLHKINVSYSVWKVSL